MSRLTQDKRANPERTAKLFDKVIRSRSNELFHELLSCLTSKGIRKTGYFLVPGEKAVLDTVENFPSLVRSILLPLSEAEALQAEQSFAKSSGAHQPPIPLPDSTVLLLKKARQQTAENSVPCSVVAIATSLFQELDIAGTKKPLLLVTTPEIPEVDFSKDPVGLEVICALGDPSNLGALIRSASAFGVRKIILLKECASPFHPKAVRAASAATLTICFEHGPSIQELPRHQSLAGASYPWLALDMGGESLAGFSWPENLRLVLGEEGRGLPQPHSFRTLAVPMSRHRVESLNATVASSIALYAYRVQHPLG